MTADAGLGKRLARWLGATSRHGLTAGRRGLAGTVAPGSDTVMLLEERILLDAEPVVTIVPTLTTAALGSSFGITLNFDNVSDADPGSTTGYAPYIDLILPTVGKDGAGAAGDDGISFGSATFLGQPVTATTVTFDASGNAVHPFAVDASGNPRIVTGTPGDTLVVLTLPFGSFTADQTPVDINVSLNLSPLADFDPAHIADQLQITAQGGFALGRDPLNNPTVDAPILQVVPSLGTVSPSLVTLTKVSNAPEGETATGPNFEHVWTIDLDVAAGQTITDAHIRDLLPSNIVYLGSTVVVGNGTLVSAPTIGSVVDPANNILDYDFGTLVGAAGVDARITVRFYVADVSGAGNAVINPSTGSPTVTQNDVEVEGALVPFDPRDPTIPFVEGRGVIDNTIINRSVAIQKSSAITIDNNVTGLSPGDVLTYTLNMQLSDFFTAGDIVLTDLLGDGQRLDTSFIPVFTVIERGVTTGELSFAGTSAVGGELVGGNFTSVFNGVNGTTALTINMSNEIDSRNLFADGDGILAGGRTRAGDALAMIGATTISVSFRAVVQNNFIGPHIGQAVNQGDSVGDNAAVAATIRNNATLAATGSVNDASSLLLPIAGGSVDTKDIVAVNGVDVSGIGAPLVTPGDTVTFRVRYTLPSSSFETFKLTDFLPLPVLPAAQLTQSADPAGTTPGVNQWNYGSGDTFHLLPSAPTPTATAPSVAGNSFAFDYGSYAVQNQPGGVPQTSIVEILFTMRIADAAFGDRLLLTNLVTATEANSVGATLTTNEITQFTMTQPVLTITKGIVDAAGNNTVTFQGSRSPASVSFAGATGNAGAAAFTGTITDAALATGAINANLTGIDAGDKVTFAITINNNGTGRNGAFDVAIRDSLPAGFAIPVDAIGLNLKVTTGAGTAVAFTNVGGGSGLFDQGIVLTDGASGAIAPDTDGDATTGTSTNDIIVITFDLVATTAVQPKQTWTNTATIDRYAALEGGTNFVPPAGLADTATVTTRDPDIAKVLFTTDQSFTTGSAVAIGEVATFRVTYSLPEGTINAVTLRDVLPTGLTPISATVVSVGGGITGPGVPTVGATAILSGNTFDFGLGDIAVSADNDATNDTIVIEVVARVADIANNSRGRNLDNSGRLLFTTTTETGGLVPNTLTSTARVTVRTPDLNLTKTVTPDIADEGDVVTYTLRLTNPSATNATTAFDITTIDSSLVALGFSNITIVGVTSSGAVNAGATNTAGTITITVDSLDVGGNINVQFTAQVGDVPAGTVLVNTARITEYSSLPGVVPGERVITNEPAVTATVTVPAVAETKTLITTSIGNDANPQVQIGETATFDIVATLPEGSTTLTITDLLPSGANVLTFVSTTVLSIGGNTALGATSGGSLSNSLIGVGAAGVISGDGTTATFSFGTIKNTPDGVENASDRIVIRVTTLVPDVPANTAADNAVINTAIATFDTSTTTATSSLEIIEPVLTIVKTAPVGTVDAGARLDYSFVITNTGDGTAFDVTVADPLAANLTLVPGSISYTGAASGTAANFGDILIAALAPGQSVTVRYQADVGDGIILGSTIVNTATTSYDSLPGVGNVGRVPDPPPSSTANVPTGGPVTLDKAIVNTSAGNDTSTNVLIGEVITYRLTTTLPDGTTTLSLTDTLPSGLDYIIGSARVISAFGNTGVTATITEAGATTTFDFGSITNPGDNIANPDQTVIVEIQARVADIPANQSGVTHTNSATATTGIGSASDTQAVSIIAPALGIDKTSTTTTAATGDTVLYRVTLRHLGTSTAPASDVVITDNLAGGGLTLVPGSVIIISGPGSVIDGTTVTVSIPVLELSETTVIEYRAIVAPGTSGGTLVNTANAGFDSLPGPGGRPGNVDDSVTIGRPDFTKTITATSLADTGSEQFRPGNVDLAIGERVTYDLVVTLPTTTTQVRVSDTLLATGATGLLQLVGVPVITLGSGVTANNAAPTLVKADTNGDGVDDSLFWDFGNVVSASPGGTITITVTGLTLDRLDDGSRPGNSAGDLLALPAQLDFGSGTITAAVSVDIVEPDLTLAKSVTRTMGDNGTINGLLPPAGTLVGTAGDVFTYTLTIGHAAGSSGPAYDLSITDTLGTGLVLVSGSASTSFAGATVSATASGLTVNAATLLPGQSFTVTYQARIADSTVYDTTLPNAAHLDYDTLPGAGGRAFAADAAAAVTLQGNATLNKSIIATSNSFTGSDQFNPGNPDVTIGETITYRLVATLAEGTTPSLVIVDRLPSGADGVVEHLASARPVLGAGITAQNPNPTPVLTDTDGDGRIDSIRWDFGRVTNAGDNRIDAGDTITIDVTGRVADDARNSSGDLLVNVARLDAATVGTTITATASANADIVEPKLVIDKIATDGLYFPGQTASYTVTVQHAPGSTAAAADVVVRDLLPPDLTLVPGTLVILSAPQGTTPNIDGTSVSLPVLPLGTSLVFEFQAVIGFTVDTTVPLINTAIVDFDSNPGAGGRPASASDTAELIVTPPFFPPAPRPVLPGLRHHEETLPSRSDGRFVEHLPRVDAIYTGTAQPGARVTVRIADAIGAPAGIAHVTTDAGGNWLVLMPTVTATELMRNDSQTQWFERSSLFTSPVGLEKVLADGLGERIHRVVAGADLPDAPYKLSIEQSPAGFALDDAASTNLRSYFAPAWRDQLFAEQPLSIATVFRDIAGTAVARDFAADLEPIGFGVNAFNAEFLANAQPGSTR